MESDSVPWHRTIFWIGGRDAHNSILSLVDSPDHSSGAAGCRAWATVLSGLDASICILAGIRLFALAATYNARPSFCQRSVFDRTISIRMDRRRWDTGALGAR